MLRFIIERLEKGLINIFVGFAGVDREIFLIMRWWKNWVVKEDGRRRWREEEKEYFEY